MEEFDNVFKVMVELKRTEPIENVLKRYAEQHADDLEAVVASLKTERLEQCPILPPDAGR
jgi:F0F1-type ATP synthase delta subunit